MNAVLSVLLIACATIAGARKVIVDVRDIHHIRALRVDGSFLVTVEVGKPEQVHISSEHQHRIDNVVTEVEDGVLTIRPKDPNSKKDTDVVIVVNILHLREIETSGSVVVIVNGQLNAKVIRLTANGSSRITANVDCEKLYATMNGAGYITVSGKAKIAYVVINGAGIYAAGELKTVITDIDVTGSGDLLINASEKITGNSDGSILVKYRDSPKIDIRVRGYKKLIQV